MAVVRPLITTDSVTMSRGMKTVLDQVTVAVNEGDRIGVVGLNGGGKSTLLGVLTREVEPDSGRVTHGRNVQIATVAQRASSSSDTVIQAIVGEKAAHEWAADPEVRSIIAGLELSDLLDEPTNAISGGQFRRTMLAAALVQDVDVLILDEPTNHLDIEGVQWLADFLRRRNCAQVIVTHDRWFLDTVATRTWEVHDGVVDTYEGGYNDWMFARAERQRQADAAEQRRQNLARKELAWLRRGAPARTSKPRYRVEAAEALIADVPAPRDSVELMAFSAQRQGKIVVDVCDARIATPDGRVLVDDVTWRLGPGERIGLVGVNGSGKTTLLRTIAGEYPLAAGYRREGKTLRLGWLRQELEDIPDDLTVLEAVTAVAEYVVLGTREMSASQVAERLGFPVKRQRQPVRDLSGGERRRLQLTRILMSEPNVLLLDEPTNDLDIDTLQELESMLDGWPGTLVVISHDRYLVERVCDSTFALFGDGRVTHLPGGIDEYLDRRRSMVGHAATGSGFAAGTEAISGPGHARPVTTGAVGGENSGASAGGEGAVSGRPVGRPGSGQSAVEVLSAAEKHKISKEMNSLERKIAKIQSREEMIEREMAEIASDPGGIDTEKLTVLDTKLSQAREEREELEMAWMECGEKIENN
ncbi:ABC-F family ATP-binding cassette domain-containing protein [Corynebacterium kroppenstedtii]|uniref:ABC-F family ATP-binding cassette domain-containing protein n=1 Tax=Corynebacterium sp. PCR 32 TaxID=3351342 RepID=UPI0030A5DD67